MITIALLIYIGVQISAPTWYFVLTGVGMFCKIYSAGVNLGKKVKEIS